MTRGQAVRYGAGRRATRRAGAFENWRIRKLIEEECAAEKARLRDVAAAVDAGERGAEGHARARAHPADYS